MKLDGICLFLISWFVHEGLFADTTIVNKKN